MDTDVIGKVYMPQHFTIEYVQDAAAQFVINREAGCQIKPKTFFKEYFATVQKGTHILFRSYKYVNATPYNRLCVLKAVIKIFKPFFRLNDRYDTADIHSLLVLVFPDFPLKVVEDAFTAYDNKKKDEANSLLFLDWIKAVKESFCTGPLDKEGTIISKQIAADIDEFSYSPAEGAVAAINPAAESFVNADYHSMTFPWNAKDTGDRAVFNLTLKSSNDDVSEKLATKIKVCKQGAEAKKEEVDNGKGKPPNKQLPLGVCPLEKDKKAKPISVSTPDPTEEPAPTLSAVAKMLKSSACKRLKTNYYIASCKYSSKMSDSSPNCHEKNTGDRKLYTIPEDYEHSTDVGASNESTTLLQEIYSNLSSRTAKFNGPYGNRSVVYCDYAASGQSVNFIEDYIKGTVLPFYGNIHSTTTVTSLRSTYFRHEAREIIRKAVNASKHDALIFTGSGCTSAVNKLIHALNIKLPVVVFVGPYEHHSNLLPWREINAKVIRIKEDSNGLIDIAHLEEELKKHYGTNHQLIGAFSAASNVTGIITDDISISTLLHKHGALAFWDYAAAGPYVKIDMNPVIMGENEGLAYKDAIFLSPHKFVGGPETPGILIAKKSLFSNSVPCEPGGGTVFFETRDTHRYLKDIETKEEGGTPSIIGAIRAGMAFQLKEAVGIDVISGREKEICRMVLSKWKSVTELKILGSTSVSRLPIFSFMIYHPKSGLYLHHNFVCALLNDMFGIQTRSGCACAGPYALDLLGIDKPLAQQFDILLAENSLLDRTHRHRKGEYSEREVLHPGFVRLTFPYFMSEQDIEFVVNSVEMVAIHGWKELPQYLFNPETGEWKHKMQQNYVDQKWLGSISYKSGTFTVKENKISDEAPLKNMDVLQEAKKSFQGSEEAALKKFTPDQHLIFDAESSKLRWFLLPSEAKKYLLGELVTKIKDPVFFIRKEYSLKEYESRSCALVLPSNERKGKWHSPPNCIFNPFLKAVQQFEMVKDGDKVLVCLSCGKDSLSLLHTLHHYQFYAKERDINFELGAMTVDPKSSLYDSSPLKEYLKSLNVPYFYEEQGQAENLENCTSICSFCSSKENICLKREKICACACREGYNVIALGQHLDDLTESFLMSVFHNGRLRTMKAHYIDKSSSLRITRPFVYVREKDLRNFAEKKKLPIIAENYPACFETPNKLYHMKQLLAAEEVKFPNIYESLKNALFPLMSGKSALLYSNKNVEEKDEDSH